ncbi:MAG: GDP-mannose 4,6-dehydratase [Elusimicrobia bacterium]|nr:GDP-mannose 4,6-dehydratase [Elusimicrobiota bacterium]
MSEKILITGITGFVGSHLADFLLARGHKVYGTKRWHLSRTDNIRHVLDRVALVDCDITDPIGARKLIDAVRPDKIFHCASQSFVSPSWDHPSLYMDVNYKGTVNLLESVRQAGLNCRVHIPGSGEEYGDIEPHELPIREETVLRPVNPYAVSKIAQDLIAYVYCRSYGVPVIRTRAFNHEGPRRDKVFGIPWYAYQIARIELGLQEPVIKVGHIDDLRNFTHILDIVEAYWLAMEKCEPGSIHLIGSEDKAQVHTFREALEQLMGMSTFKNLRYETDPQYVRPTQVPRLLGDMSRFRRVTQWRPKISFEQILHDTLSYWRDRERRENPNAVPR